MARSMPKTEPLPPVGASLGTPVIDQVVDDFLSQLASDSSVPPAVIARLRAALVEKKDISSDALREALFTETIE